MDSGLKLWGIMSSSAIVLPNSSPTLVKVAARLAKVVFGDRIQICDNVLDNVEILAAITAAAGGETVLLEGDYTCDAFEIDGGHVRGEVTTGYVGTTITVNGTITVRRGNITDAIVNPGAGLGANPCILQQATPGQTISNITRLFDQLYVIDPAELQTAGQHGIMVDCTGTAGGTRAVETSNYGAMWIRGFDIGFYVYVTENGGDAWWNSNSIDSLYVGKCKTNAHFENTNAGGGYGEMAHNMPLNIHTENPTNYGLRWLGDGAYGNYLIVECMDIGGGVTAAIQTDAHGNGYVGRWNLDDTIDTGYDNNWHRVQDNYEAAVPNVIIVSDASGGYGNFSGQYDNLHLAINDIGVGLPAATANNKYLIRVYGQVDEGNNSIQLKSYVDVEGVAGAIITSTNSQPVAIQTNAVTDCTMRNLTINYTGTVSVRFLRWTNTATNVRFENVRWVDAENGTSNYVGIYTEGTADGDVTMNNCEMIIGDSGGYLYLILFAPAATCELHIKDCYFVTGSAFSGDKRGVSHSSGKIYMDTTTILCGADEAWWLQNSGLTFEVRNCHIENTAGNLALDANNAEDGLHFYNTALVGTIGANAQGFDRYNCGTATILNGNAAIVVAHHLGGTPTSILVTGTHAEATQLYVHTIGAANFTITTAVGVTSDDREVFWEAWIGKRP